MNDTKQKLESALRDSVSSVLLKNEEIINRLDDIKTIAGWYKEAKQDRKKIPSIIVNNIIEEILSHSNEYFINSLTESIKIKCQVDLQSKEVKGDILINLKSLKPYVEFIKVVDGKKIPPSLRITFKVDLKGTLEGLKIAQSRTTNAGEIVKKEISLKKFSFDLTISIVKLPDFNLDPPIILSHNEIFKVKDLHFYF